MFHGIVEKGKQLGRTIGFPTANIGITDEGAVLPENGVYVAALWIGDDECAIPGMLNQGHHPTAPEGNPTVEVHLFGFEGDIYGESIRLEYLHFLRPERRFESLEALMNQLIRDKKASIDWIKNNAGHIRWHDGYAAE